MVDRTFVLEVSFKTVILLVLSGISKTVQFASYVFSWSLFIMLMNTWVRHNIPLLL
jgi:hypothetical protein